MHTLRFFLLFALLFSLGFAAFELRSSTLNVYLDGPDLATTGKVQVTEEFEIALTTQDSIELYRSGLAAPTANDLAAWQTRTGINEIGYHLSPANGSLTNVRVQPQTPYLCNQITGVCVARIILSYDYAPTMANNAPVNGTGLFNLDSYKPRTTRFTLNPEHFSFPTNENKDVILSSATTLIFHLPNSARVISIQPPPPELAGARPPYAGVTTFTWKDMILTRFEFTFELEDQLQTEVLGFFSQLEQSAVSLIFGPEGLILVFILLIAFGSYVYLNQMKKKG